MRTTRQFLVFLIGWHAALALLIFAPLAFATPANTITQPIPTGSPVYTGVGAPRAYIDVMDSGGEILTDGTSPILVPWGGVLEVTCTALAAGENALICFSMHVDAVPDVSDGQLSDGTIDAECHGMFLVPEKPSNDMRLAKTRFRQLEENYAGAQFTGACYRPGTAYHLAPCTVAGEAADCGAASTCDTGCWRSSATDNCTTRSIDMIAGAWVIGDTSAASETCFFRVDI